jgi:hypothetical protein
VLEARARKGQSAPALDREPVLFDDLRSVWEVFLRISPRRAQGFNGPMPLGTREIYDTLALYGFEGEEIVTAFELIAVLDAELLRKNESK